MTPQQKAKELLSKYYLQVQTLEQQKKCALIAVDEMLSLRYLLKKETWFYKEVKKEINKL